MIKINEKLIAYYNKLILNEHKNIWFEKNIKGKITETLQWFLFPEFRSGKGIKDFFKTNKWIVVGSTILIIWTSGIFSIGRFLSFSEKKEKITSLEYKLDKTNDIIYYTNDLLCRKDSTISQLRQQMNSREFLQYIIKRDCKIQHYDNLCKLPDDVFFTMIDEVEKYQIPYTIFFRVIDNESGFKFIPNMCGSGALGYCQVMPITFQTVSRRLGLKKHDEINNIKTGAYLLKSNYNGYRRAGLDDKSAWLKALIDYSNGDLELAKSEMKYFKTNIIKK